MCRKNKNNCNNLLPTLHAWVLPTPRQTWWWWLCGSEGGPTLIPGVNVVVFLLQVMSCLRKLRSSLTKLGHNVSASYTIAFCHDAVVQNGHTFEHHTPLHFAVVQSYKMDVGLSIVCLLCILQQHCLKVKGSGVRFAARHQTTVVKSAVSLKGHLFELFRCSCTHRFHVLNNVDRKVHLHSCLSISSVRL